MAGTTYNTLNLGTAVEARKATSSRKVVAVAAVVVAACVMFFAGRVYQGNTTPFTHAEVMNVATTCAEGEFIGQCTTCRDCAEYEYKNGGCSFFKDTFCSFCEPIAHCQREAIRCTTDEDQTCSACDCMVQASSWEDVTTEFALATGYQGPTYSCYIGDFTVTNPDGVCVPCTVCAPGFWQESQCDPVGEQGNGKQDTVCKRCQVCPEGTYVSEPCTYMSDTVCLPCTDCDDDEMTKGLTRKTVELDNVDGTCTGIVGNNRNNITEAGHDNICKPCTQCRGSGVEFVDTPCTATQDSHCTACHACGDGEYVNEFCEDSSEVFAVTTADLSCNKCSELPLGTDEDPVFVESLCDKTSNKDFSGKLCTKCQPHEFVSTPCDIGSVIKVGSDTDCDDCMPLEGCENTDLRCTAQGKGYDSQCIGCVGTEQFATWGNCCSEGRLGPKCGWYKTENGCEPDDKSYRERRAKRNGFKGTTNPEFILWCKKQCDAFPDCTAFEVDDCFLGDESCVNDDSLCSLKNQVEMDWGSGPSDKTCYVSDVPMSR